MFCLRVPPPLVFLALPVKQLERRKSRGEAKTCFSGTDMNRMKFDWCDRSNF